MHLLFLQVPSCEFRVQRQASKGNVPIKRYIKQGPKGIPLGHSNLISCFSSTARIDFWPVDHQTTLMLIYGKDLHTDFHNNVAKNMTSFPILRCSLTIAFLTVLYRIVQTARNRLFGATIASYPGSN